MDGFARIICRGFSIRFAFGSTDRGLRLGVLVLLLITDRVSNCYGTDGSDTNVNGTHTR